MTQEKQNACIIGLPNKEVNGHMEGVIGQCSGMDDNVVKMFPFSLCSPLFEYIDHGANSPPPPQQRVIYPTSTVR